MKGKALIRPLMYESLDETKRFHLDYIQTCRDLIDSIRVYIRKHPQEDHALAREVIASNQKIIRETFADLKEMQRWWTREGKNVKNKRVLAETSTN